MDKQLLIQYLSHDCNEEEKKQVREWISANPSNRQTFFEMERIWSLADEAKYADPDKLDAAFNRLSHTIGIAQPDNHIRMFIRQWAGYAAALIILVVFSIHLLITNQEKEGEETASINTIEVPRGQHASITLSDGTRVTLNSASKFEYPSDFLGKGRTVRLIGEAHFDVAHKNGQPFTVVLPQLNVTVLGTTFNAKGYTDEGGEVTLEKGKVKVSLSGATSSQSWTLKPNQQLCCSLNRDVTVKEIDPSDATSWMVGEYFFDDQTLSEIMKTLEREFNVTIHIQDPALAAQRFTCHTKENVTLSQILDVLQNTRKMHYIQNENTIIILTSKYDSL